jgi:hypothetical protein
MRDGDQQDLPLDQHVLRDIVEGTGAETGEARRFSMRS